MWVSKIEQVASELFKTNRRKKKKSFLRLFFCFWFAYIAIQDPTFSLSKFIDNDDDDAKKSNKKVCHHLFQFE